MYLHANDIIQILPGEPTAVETQQDIQEQQTTPEQTIPEQQTAQGLTEQDQTIRKWAGYDTQSATDAQLIEAVLGKTATDGQTVQIPGWVRGDLAEWYVSGDITYEGFVTVIQYMYDAGLLVSEGET